MVPQFGSEIVFCGSTGHELHQGSYRAYTGVDISEVAVQRARQTSALAGRSDRNRFLQGDITTYVPDTKADVILFKDCLYYVPWRQVKAMLMRYSHHLADGGVFIARFASLEKYAPLIGMIERDFAVLDKESFDRPPALVLVFRGNRATR